jgi:hypothetical protein
MMTGSRRPKTLLDTALKMNAGAVCPREIHERPCQSVRSGKDTTKLLENDEKPCRCMRCNEQPRAQSRKCFRAVA